MSQRLISLNDDLRRLRDDGYEVAVVAGHLVVSHVPYVDAARQVRYGTVVSALELSGDVTVKPALMSPTSPVATRATRPAPRCPCSSSTDSRHIRSPVS